MKTTLPILTEDQEQMAFVEYLEARGLKFTAIPNSTYTKSWAIKNRNKRLGLRAGLPDLLVVLPGIGLAFPEMKRTKGGVTSDVQKEWITALNAVPNVEARVCKGAVEAIAFIEELLPQDKRNKLQTSSIF